MKILNYQVLFHSPPKRAILVFDQMNSHYITNYILAGHPLFILSVSPIKLYISPAIVFNYFLSLRVFKWEEMLAGKNVLRAALKQIRYIYLFACVKCISPRIVTTVIDNSSDFHWLCRHYHSAQFFAIQNGNRLNLELSSGPKQFHQHFFCFGNYEIENYRRCNYEVENFHPVGSLLAGYYKHIQKDKCKILYDLTIISNRNFGRHISGVYNDYWPSADLMNQHAARYVKENNIKMAVLLCKPLGQDSSKDDYEGQEEHYKRIFGDDVALVGNNPKNFSTYHHMNLSNIIIGSGSTVVREAFGWGKKVLYCDFTGNNKYHDYDPMIVFRDKNYDSFKKRLDELRAEPYDEYKKRTKDYASYVMNNDPNCPPHIYIRKKIEEYL